MRHSLQFLSPRAALSVLATAALLAACGGDELEDLQAAAARDEPDAATLTEARGLVEQAAKSLADASPQAAEAASAMKAFSAKPAANGNGNSNGNSNNNNNGFDGFPGVKQINLVANKPGFGAPIIEPELRDAWGIAIRPAGLGGHFWIGAAGSGKSIQYVGDVGGTPLFQDELAVVDTGGPVTGVAFNPGSNFTITQQHANGPITAPTKFFFANLSGTLTAWTERARPGGGFDHPLDSVTVFNGSATGSSFTGVTVAATPDRLYASDFGAQPDVRVFDAAFKPLQPLPNPFRGGGTASKPDFEAFNVQTLGNSTFAMYGRHVGPGVPLPQEGRLMEFDAQGKPAARWFGRGLLHFPWGVAQAPKEFGLYGGCLIVGNFGDGTLVAFHPRLRVAMDYVRDGSGKPVVIDGLWALQFGNGASLGEAKHMYFSAGPNRGADGLFGKLLRNPKTLPVLAGLSLCR